MSETNAVIDGYRFHAVVGDGLLPGESLLVEGDAPNQIIWESRNNRSAAPILALLDAAKRGAEADEWRAKAERLAEELDAATAELREATAINEKDTNLPAWPKRHRRPRVGRRST